MRILVKEIWRNLDGRPKINSEATKCFGFSGPKVAHIGPGVELFPLAFTLAMKKSSLCLATQGKQLVAIVYRSWNNSDAPYH